MPACAATIRSPQTVAMSRPSWNSWPFTSREPHGDGPNGSVIRPFGSGQTYPSRRDGAGGGAQVWTRRRSGLAGRPATGPDTIAAGAAGEAPAEGADGEGGSEGEAGGEGGADEVSCADGEGVDGEGGADPPSVPSAGAGAVAGAGVPGGKVAAADETATAPDAAADGAAPAETGVDVASAADPVRGAVTRRSSPGQAMTTPAATSRANPAGRT